MYAASSGVARGITPGSLKLVRKSADMTNTNRSAPITGIAGVIRTARNGQLNNTTFSIIKLAFFSVDFKTNRGIQVSHSLGKGLDMGRSLAQTCAL